MIIDCHGHYTTAPAALDRYHRELLSWSGGAEAHRPTAPQVSDDEVRASLAEHQLDLMARRGIDVVLFSPKASAMAHHVPDQKVARAWAAACNDLVAQAATLFPEAIAPVCQLPQTPEGGLDDAVVELRRCVEELGFVGANVNPDPSGGYWRSPPLIDPWWYPLFEAAVELEVPLMVHVSTSCNPSTHTLGAHYLNADTTVFMQFVEGDLFARFPTLQVVVPHGGGAVPYHWGRFEGLAVRLGRPPVEEHVMGNVSFDTCVYHRPGMALLADVVAPERLLFASEMLGAVRGVNPATGADWDDTRRYVDAVVSDAGHRHLIYEANARRVYPRLDARLREQGR